MLRFLLPAALLVLPAAVSAPAAAQEAASSLAEAVRDGRPVASLRYRFENVADDAVGGREARASTLRTVLGYETGAWRGWRFYAEAENVAVVGDDLYDNAGAGSLGNGVRNRPVVADPAGTEIQQAYLRLDAAGVEGRLGRQEIVLGDSRFVGNVGWRQNHQSFDALRLSRPTTGRVGFDYAFLTSARRINGGSHDMESHVARATVGLGETAAVAAYALYLDYDDPAQLRLSSATLGAEVAGAWDRGGWKLLYEVEHARQRDAADNPGTIDAGYTHLMVGAAATRLTVKLGWEALDGSAADGQFQTPLATLHRFNGWADKFLTTPRDGLEDAYLALAGNAGPVAWTVVFHDFAARTGGADYGDELDLQLLYTAPWKQVFAAKAALYDAAGFAADTEKVMLWTSFSI